MTRDAGRSDFEPNGVSKCGSVRRYRQDCGLEVGIERKAGLKVGAGLQLHYEANAVVDGLS